MNDSIIRNFESCAGPSGVILQAAPAALLIKPMALKDSLPIRGPQPRILIVRMSALGDIVFATSLLSGLRDCFPQAHIAWLVQNSFSAMIEGDPRINELISIPRETLRSPAALLQLRRKLTARRYDWVIDCQGLLKSRIFASLAGDAIRIGFDSKEPGAFLMHHRFPKGGMETDISSEYRYLAEQITGRKACPPQLLVSTAHRDKVSAAMTEYGLVPGFIALCPFTTRPQKHWMEDYWPKLAHLLEQSRIEPMVMFGGPGDLEAAQRIATQLPASSVNLVGKTRLQDLSGWLQQARLVIGVDTGLTHIGVALRRPVLALFGSTLPYRFTTGSPLQVIHDDLPCSPCHRSPTCNGRFDCLRGITPERVAAAAQQLLSTAGPA